MQIPEQGASFSGICWKKITLLFYREPSGQWPFTRRSGYWNSPRTKRSFFINHNVGCDCRGACNSKTYYGYPSPKANRCSSIKVGAGNCYKQGLTTASTARINASYGGLATYFSYGQNSRISGSSSCTVGKDRPILVTVLRGCCYKGKWSRIGSRNILPI